MHVPRSRGATAITALVLALSPVAAASVLAAPPPAAADDSYSTAEDTELVVGAAEGLLTNDGEPGTGKELCVANIDDSGLHGTLAVDRDGSFTYTPSSNYNGSGGGNSFEYQLFEVDVDATCEGTPGSTGVVEITVTSVNDAPTAAADSFQALKNATLNIGAPGVLSNDGDIDGDSLTAVKVNNPTHGVVVLAADGSFSYTPAANYTGVDTFSYKASDGDATSPTRVVTITVSGIPPINTPTPPPPTPLPTVPTPGETLTPILTPPPVDVTLEPGASPTEFVPPTPQLSGGAPSAGASVPSLAPGETPQPGDASGSGFGSPLTILLGIVLLALIVGVAAAMWGPGWLARRRGEG